MVEMQPGHQSRVRDAALRAEPQRVGLSPSIPVASRGLGPTFSSSRSRMRTSAGLLPGSRSTFLCRDHLHMPGRRKGTPQPRRAGLRGDPSEQDQVPEPQTMPSSSHGADPRPGMAPGAGGRACTCGEFSPAALVGREFPVQTGGRWI